ncbi:MAG: toxin-antitoxin system protein [Actinomycetota bacterium]|nr:toxin-antitoxin system protein [Actinomycetota bacterium]
MPDLTTIKVSRGLRERISRDAAQRGVTAAALIGELLDSYEREQRFAAVKKAYAGTADLDYAEETGAWDAVVADGLSE